MKRLVAAAAVLGVLVAVIFRAEHEREQPAVDPAPVLNVLGDVQRAVAGVPARAGRMSDADEIAVGNSVLIDYPAAAARQVYVARVGRAVASGAKRRLPYAFQVIDEPGMVNAFALPGGRVFIATGLIDLMATEDELAAVLAHELEHIDHYHCADRYQAERAAAGGALGAIMQLPLWVFAAGYSKTQELEADAEGTRLASAAGYAPLAVIRLFEAMVRPVDRPSGGAKRAGSPVEEVLGLPESAVEGYFRSHPPTVERIARIRDVVRQDRLDPAHETRPLELSPASR